MLFTSGPHWEECGGDSETDATVARHWRGVRQRQCCQQPPGSQVTGREYAHKVSGISYRHLWGSFIRGAVTSFVYKRCNLLWQVFPRTVLYPPSRTCLCQVLICGKHPEKIPWYLNRSQAAYCAQQGYYSTRQSLSFRPWMPWKT